MDLIEIINGRHGIALGKVRRTVPEGLRQYSLAVSAICRDCH